MEQYEGYSFSLKWYDNPVNLMAIFTFVVIIPIIVLVNLFWGAKPAPEECRTKKVQVYRGQIAEPRYAVYMGGVWGTIERGVVHFTLTGMDGKLFVARGDIRVQLVRAAYAEGKPIVLYAKLYCPGLSARAEEGAYWEVTSLGYAEK